mmetsp:Transcript_23692/g.46661  ORF Transcript_23692/g.46661 Transcript_23692/m.46661 type:complete len:382 (+) Transcript_23692:1052-2197(+)
MSESMSVEFLRMFSLAIISSLCCVLSFLSCLLVSASCCCCCCMSRILWSSFEIFCSSSFLRYSSMRFCRSTNSSLSSCTSRSRVCCSFLCLALSASAAAIDSSLLLIFSRMSCFRCSSISSALRFADSRWRCFSSSCCLFLSSSTACSLAFSSLRSRVFSVLSTKSWYCLANLASTFCFACSIICFFIIALIRASSISRAFSSSFNRILSFASASLRWYSIFCWYCCSARLCMFCSNFSFFRWRASSCSKAACFRAASMLACRSRSLRASSNCFWRALSISSAFLCSTIASRWRTFSALSLSCSFFSSALAFSSAAILASLRLCSAIAFCCLFLRVRSSSCCFLCFSSAICLCRSSNSIFLCFNCSSLSLFIWFCSSTCLL